MTCCYVALGSNQRQPAAQLRRAVAAIGQLPESLLHSVSHCYRSAAVGPGDQPDYLNAVARLQTSLDPLALLDLLQAIEHNQGRVRSVRWGARTLDLDLLLYDKQVMDSQRLTLPHPRLAQRNFVLVPLAEIAPPNLMLPDGRDLDTLLRACPPGELSISEDSLVPPG